MRRIKQLLPVLLASATLAAVGCNIDSDELGPEQGSVALDSLEQLCRLCKQHGRRPLMRPRSWALASSASCRGTTEPCRRLSTASS